MRCKLVATIALGILCAAAFVGCSKSIKLNYAETYKIQDEKLNGKSNLTWKSENTDIVDVSEDGTVEAKAPGKAKVDIKDGNTLLATYVFDVSVVPIKEIVFATDNMEITDDGDNEIKYTLLPQGASDYGITWTSADESVATVDENGKLEAQSAGETVIVATTENGVSAQCAVTVTKVNAWERLSEDEKKFVEAFLPKAHDFKNPGSINFLEVRSNPLKANDTDVWYFTVSATNGYGADIVKTYSLLGGSFGGMMIDADKVTGKTEYNAELITQAVHEKLGY